MNPWITKLQAEIHKCVENLWKHETSESSSLYVELLEPSLIPSLLTQAPQKDCGKCTDIADKHRMAGDQLLNQTKYVEAMEEYNKSLCYAEFGSESMGLAYANRSSCFLHLEKYDNCLVDIELAGKSNYPQRLMARLKQREANCMEKRSQLKTVKSKLELSYSSNASIPCMANSLEIRQNDQFGRHIVANRDIPAGKTVLIEPVFIASTSCSEWAVCSVCQQTVANLMPCAHCTTAMFCSAECLNRSRGYHSMECGYVFTDFGALSRTIFIALHACGGGSVDELMTFVERVQSEPASVPTSAIESLEQYRAFLQLHICDYERDASNAARITQAYHFITTVPRMAHLFDTLAKQRFLVHLLVMHELIISDNAYGYAMSAEDSRFSIGLIVSLFNHQCASNAVEFFIGGKVVVTTVRPIQKGHQVFLSYVDNKVPSPHQFIFDKFGFWCECSKCVPAVISPGVMQLMEDDDDFRVIREMRSFVSKDIALWTMAKERCIGFLNRYGHLPHNCALELAKSVFTDCILYEQKNCN